MALFKEPNPDMTKINFVCWQKEICPTTGKIHYQTYVEFKGSYKLKDCQKYIDVENAHIESRKTNYPYVAMLYCKNNEHWEEKVKGNPHIGDNAKDKTGQYEINSYKQFGEEPKRKTNKGKRTEIAELKKIIKEGKSYDEIAIIFPELIIKYSKGIKELISIRNKEESKNFRKLENTVFWGNAGSKKSKEVYDLEGVDNIYKLDKAKNEAWFCGYAGEKVLLIDDFYGWIPYDMLLNILDGYRLRIQIKGGHDWAKWEKVYITSNKPYESWYNNKCETELEPLTRRLNYIVEINRKEEIRKPERLTIEELKEKRKMLNEKLKD